MFDPLRAGRGNTRYGVEECLEGMFLYNVDEFKGYEICMVSTMLHLNAPPSCRPPRPQIQQSGEIPAKYVCLHNFAEDLHTGGWYYVLTIKNKSHFYRC